MGRADAYADVIFLPFQVMAKLLKSSVSFHAQLTIPVWSLLTLNPGSSHPCHGCVRLQKNHNQTNPNMKGDLIPSIMDWFSIFFIYFAWKKQSPSLNGIGWKAYISLNIGWDDQDNCWMSFDISTACFTVSVTVHQWKARKKILRFLPLGSKYHVMKLPASVCSHKLFHSLWIQVV